ncbi:MAG TPA: ribonucleotide-diphosphate reductase subunit beta [Solirubrobacteraceae bacterium]|jgi:ribonucleotide reductase beta subunit family protein with ferritin-like domain/putative sterol carrier protein|nr:ribonucleotide-diphosphate reductase subunit beta [Solirubrobacteraceae bacterium]
MASAATTTRPIPTTDSSNPASLPADAISYEDLYARWERGNWRATELDFTEDARQWREDFSEFERTAALWNYSLFFWGEDAVADNLSPYIDAAPLEEQKYFLTTQQVDEARHAVFFKRFMQEVCGIGDGSMDSGLRAIKPQLTPGFRKIFDRLDRMADELRADRSPAQLAAAVTLYHIVIEAALAQPGQHFICSYLEARDQLPAFREGMQNIAADEQRHIGFGVKLLADLAREDPVRVPKAVAKILRDVTRYTAQVLMPPGWDERYITVFGATYDEVGVEGLTSMTTKLRSAGLAAETLPGPALLPPGLTPLEVSQRGRALAQAGVIGVREGPSKRDPETLAMLFDMIRRQVNPAHGLKRATTFQWEFTDPDVPTWHLTVENGSSTVAEGEAPNPDLRLRLAYQDWIDIVGERLDPRRAIATGRLRPRGNPLALGRLMKVFPQG